jgi:myo-inositol-1(or 4)-monophosphatase
VTTAPTLAAPEALDLLVTAVREAGEIGLRFARDGARTFSKADSSPVTEADLAIDAHLGERLRTVSPEIGWLSEETTDDVSRLARRQVWIVDPIDGTRGFVAGNGEWVISAALVADGRPIAGVLLRPTTGDLYTATAGGGARLNGAPLAIRPARLADLAGAAGPKPFVEALRVHAPRLEARPRLASLALRLAFLAENRLDAAFAKTDAHDWDLAAADLIVQEAAGLVAGFDGAPLVYNRPDPVHPPLVAASTACLPDVARVLRGAQA